MDTIAKLLTKDPSELLAEEVKRLQTFNDNLKLQVQTLELNRQRETLITVFVSKETVFNMIKPLFNMWFVHDQQFNSQPFMRNVRNDY